MRSRRLRLVLLLIVLAAAVGWLIATEGGLRLLWSGIRALSPVPIEARISGRLIGPLRIEELRVETKSAGVEVAAADLDWSPWGLFKGRILFSRADIDDLRVIVPDRPRDPDAPPPRIPGSPIPFEVRGVVRGLTVVTGGGQEIRFEKVALDAVAGPRQLRVDRLQGAGYGVDLEASGDIGLDLNGAVALDTRWSYTPPQGERIDGVGRIDGSLARPHLTQDLSGGMQARVDGSIVWMDAPFQWAARAKAAPVDLSRLHRPWRSLSVGGQIRGEGGGGRLKAEGDLILQDRSWGDWNTRAQVEKTPEGWRVPLLLLDDRKGPARIALSGLVQGGGEQVAFDGSWSDLAWPWRSPSPQISSPKGRITVEGSLAAYRIKGNADLARAGLPGGRLAIEGKGERGGLSLSHVELAWLDGVLKGEGRFDWARGIGWSAELRGENINPGHLRPDWPGRLAGRIATRGAREKGVLITTIGLHELQGELRGLPFAGGGRMTLQNGTMRLEEVMVRSGEAQFSAAGTLGKAWDLRWELAAERIQDLVPDLEGRVDASGTVRGPRDAPHLLAKGRGHAVAWQGKSVESVTLDADLDLAGETPWDARLDVKNVILGGRTVLEQIAFRLNGGPAQHRLLLDAAGAGRNMHLEGEGHYAAQIWAVQLAKGRLEDPYAGIWEQSQPTPVRVSARGLTMGDWCWERGSAKLCFAANGGASQGWRIRSALHSFPAEALAPLIPKKEIQVAGLLEGRAGLDYNRGLTGMNVELHAADGAFRFHVGQREAINTPYRTIDVTAKADGNGIAANASFQLANGDHGRAEFELPRWRPGDALSGNQPLHAAAEATLGELVWISVVAPDVVATGRLNATLTVAGTLGAPMIQGGIDLPEGQLALPLLGIALRDLHLFAYAENERSTVVKGSAFSGSGQLKVQGRVTEENEGWKLNASITGENVEAVRLPQAHVIATPDMTVEIRPRMVNLSGTLLLPRAEIDLPEFTPRASASSDVVVVDRKGEVVRKGRWTIVSQLDVRFGDNVRLQGYGLSGRLGGHITIVEPLSGGAVGRGEINILEGKYSAYGQELTIEEGRLLYGNAPLDNPGLDFRATREIDPGQPDGVVVGVVATGRLKKPEVRLYSKPVMDDSDVLAYLVLGRSIATASREEADVLQHAALSLGIAGGTAVAREIAGQFGVDVVNVQGGTERQDAALVLGKYLSPRLYVQYAVGLVENGDTVRVRYKLDHHWSLEAQSGIQSGADILYTIEK